MVAIVIIVLVIMAAIFGKKYVVPPKPPLNPPEPVTDPDPHYWKWQLIDETTERWENYYNCMKKMTSDFLLATELNFYKWVSDWDLFNKLDYWDLPDEVWINKKADCDGLARFVCDILGRFVMLIQKSITNVWWLEYYGFFREYYKRDGEWLYKVKSGGHAICVYKKDGKLLAFSNTSWWNTQDFQGFIEIGGLTFPEGLYLVICRHWETGKMEWQLKTKVGEVIEGSNIFHRKLKLIRNLKPLKRGERKKVLDFV